MALYSTNTGVHKSNSLISCSVVGLPEIEQSPLLQRTMHYHVGYGLP